MKFINYLESITGVGIYPMISLILFGSVFAGVLYFTFTASKQLIKEQSEIPLENSND